VSRTSHLLSFWVNALQIHCLILSISHCYNGSCFHSDLVARYIFQKSYSKDIYNTSILYIIALHIRNKIQSHSIYNRIRFIEIKYSFKVLSWIISDYHISLKNANVEISRKVYIKN